MSINILSNISCFSFICFYISFLKMNFIRNILSFFYNINCSLIKRFSIIWLCISIYISSFFGSFSYIGCIISFILVLISLSSGFYSINFIFVGLLYILNFFGQLLFDSKDFLFFYELQMILYYFYLCFWIHNIGNYQQVLLPFFLAFDSE